LSFLGCSSVHRHLGGGILLRAKIGSRPDLMKIGSERTTLIGTDEDASWCSVERNNRLRPIKRR
jgi:hypothetical protein